MITSFYFPKHHRWVDQCDGAHDDNRKTDKYSSVGQNWAARFGGNHDDSSEQANLMIQSWYDEVSNEKCLLTWFQLWFL